jgi:hypothetical protein
MTSIAIASQAPHTLSASSMKRYPRLLLLLAVILLASTAQAAELSTAKSELRGVTVSVTPVSVAPEAKRWSFNIVLDTHTQALNDDIEKIVTLTGSDGRPLKPLSWEGDAPGGHHRKVVVHFAPPAPAPANVELRVHREGEALARVFRFRLQ